jgi:hypothetical protein
LFRNYTGGTREGRIVLASHSELNTPDEPLGFTVKRYRADKQESSGRLFNTSVRLEPESTDPSYSVIFIDETTDSIKILAEFVEVLK